MLRQVGRVVAGMFERWSMPADKPADPAWRSEVEHVIKDTLTQLQRDPKVSGAARAVLAADVPNIAAAYAQSHKAGQREVLKQCGSYVVDYSTGVALGTVQATLRHAVFAWLMVRSS